MHNPPKGCGCVFEMKPKYYCSVKHLCPHCRNKEILASKLSDEDINKILNDLSSGKYSMIRSKSNRILILNNKTGKAKKMGYKKAIAYLKEHNYSELP